MQLLATTLLLTTLPNILSRPLTYPTTCKVFDDCPARSHCYKLSALPGLFSDPLEQLNVNVTDGMRCACNHFLAHKGPIPDINSPMADACLEDESYRGTTLIFILVVMVWQFYVVYKGVVIMWYLKKAKAFSMNASGITLMGSMLAPFFGTGVSASYALVLNRSDSEEYAIFDVLRPICFSIMSLLLIWATSTLSFMWLDILAKSNLSSDSKKYIPRIKRAHNFSVILTGIITVGGITQGRSDLAGAYQVLLCIYYTAAYKFGGSKLAKQVSVRVFWKTRIRAITKLTL